MDGRCLHHKVLFSDEDTFTTNGLVSFQNYRYWATKNPHFRINRRSQKFKKINVWSGMLPDKIIVPFLEDNFNQEVSLLLQQDGCTAHSPLLIRGQLDGWYFCRINFLYLCLLFV